MNLEDYLEPEVGIAVMAAGILFSPQARRLVRRGAVYSLTGLLATSDAMVALLRHGGVGSQSPAPSTFKQALAEEAQHVRAKHAQARGGS